MIAIELRFTAGKFHGTPWGRQVNEGAIEWPPSPWRLLRSLMSVWHHKLPDVSEDAIGSLISKLSALPSFVLPPTSSAHTRHYMPTNASAVKVFDTFAAVPKSRPLIICWPDLDLSDDQRDLLVRLVTAMSYFGRAESWVEGSVTDRVEQSFDAVPMDQADPSLSHRLEQLLAVEDENRFKSWRDVAIEKQEKALLSNKQRKADERGKPVDKIRLTNKDRLKIEKSIPQTIVQGLEAETTSLRKAGWNRPPGSRWVQYGCVEKTGPRIAVQRSRLEHAARATVARYAVTGKVVPRMTDAVKIGERARKFLMGCSKRANAQAGLDLNASIVFSGKMDQDSPLDGKHQHAHFLCEACGVDDRITHLNVFAPMGFSNEDEMALSWFNRTYGDQKHDLQFVLIGIGNPQDFGGANTKIGQSPQLSKSYQWQSMTPLVLNRHLKIKASERHDPARLALAQQREIEALVRREFSYRDWLDADQVIHVEPIAKSRFGRRWLEYKRNRDHGGGSRAGGRGYGLKITMDKPRFGPIAIGFGSHFGLGVFEPIE